ncbi:Uma2 family endonuclease [Spirulina subsalsa FACHB-351]|uniref:Uma2 family endonuclease n=1 Tax=Spirulina subsalsa FACHB-351 TaxID=234711 RepID=A0ABT3LAU0_9CYAN|nr:Uma2 family endonuclease [Spirulina subsalsa]MCW6038631.1 Uma2 family endonuclease [Spirulina subsalsa FACHB-351]
MSTESTTQPVQTTYETPWEPDIWEPEMPPDDLIFDDGEPLESNRHRMAMNVLIFSLQQAWREREDYFTGGNMFVYYSREQARNRDFRGPDFFAVLDIDGSYSREGWVVWDENGRYPDVIIELMSSSTCQVDLGEKKDIYERIFRTRNYFVYDPFDANSLQGWALDNALQYQPLVANEQGWLWSDVLGFWVGVWEGAVMRDTAPWLRFYDAQGDLVLLPEEAAQQEAQAAQQEAQRERERAQAAEERAARLAEQLRALGVDIEDD